jgi:hypothetical protein
MLKKISIVLLIIVFLPLGVIFARGRGSSLDTPDAPEFIRPISENIDLDGESSLEFKWRVSNWDISYCEFKLYKSYVTSEDNLIVSQNIPSTETSFQVEASKLEVGQVYTCVLRVVGLSGEKSDRTFQSFRIASK